VWIGAAGILFVVLVLVAARITKGSLAALSKDEKVKLVDAAARTPVYWFLIMVAIFASWVAIIALRPQFTIVATCAVLVLILALSATTGILTYRAYQRLGLPPQFLKAFLISRSLRLLGAVAIFVAVGNWLLHAQAR
jgi:hypothetical protein